MINCKTCKKEYQEQENLRGGFFCSSIVEEEYITGYYGSSIDKEKWIFIKKPSYIQEGLICDECIKKLKAIKSIEFDSMGYWE